MSKKLRNYKLVAEYFMFYNNTIVSLNILHRCFYYLHNSAKSALSIHRLC